MSRTYFITGTDTGVGKTLVAAALLEAAGARGLRTVGLKPVAAGCTQRAGEWVNEDALRLMAAATVPLPYMLVNPVALEPAIAPHVAAARAGVPLAAAPLAADCAGALAEAAADFAVVEGAGGWLVPLNATETLADVAVRLGLPVVLVVGLRLGCLNHALLTAAAIRSSGLPLAGWVGTAPGEPMPALVDNVATLRARLAAPCLGVLPDLGADPAAGLAAEHLDVLPLLEAGT